MARKNDETALIVEPSAACFDDTAGEGYRADDKRADLQALYERQWQLYDQGRDVSKADRDWFDKVVSRGEGTISDRLSALSVAVQEAPFYGLPHLERLLAMARTEKHHTALSALEHLSDVFAQVYFDGKKPRKLLYLSQRPAYDDKAKTLRWYVEDVVKRAYFQFLQLVEKFLAHSAIQHDRELAGRILFKAAMGNLYEQTQNVCVLLANKFGDVVKKISSRMIYYLEELAKRFPDLRFTIVRAVCDFLARTQLDRALYYGVTLLTQLDSKHAATCQVVLQCYAALFSKHVVPAMLKLEKERRLARKHFRNEPDRLAKEEQRLQQQLIPRMAKPLLTGLSRLLSQPELLMSDATTGLEGMRDSLGRLASQASISASLPALHLLYQVGCATGDLSVFTSILLTDKLSTKQAMWNRATCSSLLGLVREVLERERAAGRLRLSGRILKAVLRWALAPQDSLVMGDALAMVASALKLQPGLRVHITMPAHEDEADYDDKDGEGETLYELSVLSRHPNIAIAQMSKSILSQVATSDAKPAGDDLDFLDALSQWRTQPTSGGWLAFLDALRPVMEHNRPKCRAEDNRRKRVKKADSGGELGDSGDSGEEESKDGGLSDLLDDEDIIREDDEAGKAGSCFADQADYLEEIESDYEMPADKNKKPKSDALKKKNARKHSEDEDKEDDSFQSVSESEAFDGLIEEIAQFDNHNANDVAGWEEDEEDDAIFDQYEDVSDSDDEIVFDTKGSKTSGHRKANKKPPMKSRKLRR